MRLRTPARDHRAEVRVPAANLVGEEVTLAFTYEWFRYERLMVAFRHRRGRP